jgi:hypothetical protein
MKFRTYFKRIYMKSLKSNGIYHNVADLIGWGKYALYEDILP